MEFHVLAVGDITGAGGLKSVKRHLRTLKKLHHIEFCVVRSEERRVGKECRSRWSPYH